MYINSQDCILQSLVTQPCFAMCVLVIQAQGLTKFMSFCGAAIDVSFVCKPRKHSRSNTTSILSPCPQAWYRHSSYRNPGYRSQVDHRNIRDMDILKDQYLAYKSQYDTASKVYLYARKWGGPLLNKSTHVLDGDLFKNPDLASVALLLVTLYISFVFLVKAWRLTIGQFCKDFHELGTDIPGTFMFAIKGGLFCVVGLGCLGAYNAVMHGDTSIFHAGYVLLAGLFRSIYVLFMERQH